jgi:outer membrane protein OmpA-like peptidoglycan-associated protein
MHAQNVVNQAMTSGCYVVVGVFAVEQNANNFSSLISREIVVRSGQNEQNELYYVYSNKFIERSEALEELKRVRNIKNFSDAWIKVVYDRPESYPFLSKESTLTETELVTTKEDSDSIGRKLKPEIVPSNSIAPGNAKVFLNIHNAADNKVIQGRVKVIDTDRAKLIKSVGGNEFLTLPNPNSKSGTITMLCEVFGYRKVQYEMRYDEPLNETQLSFVEIRDTTVFINFDLVVFSKGEIQTLFNVYFYNDASIMMPESRYELITLFNMMEEYPMVRIRLHGHTNGNYHGKIIKVGPEKDFFSLKGSNQSSGSANDLAYGRAETIKDWLISQGIESRRIEIKSWGGKGLSTTSIA